MSHKAGEEFSGRESRRGRIGVYGGIEVEVMSVEGHRSVVDDHEHHDKATHPVDGSNTARYPAVYILAGWLFYRKLNCIFSSSSLPTCVVVLQASGQGVMLLIAINQNLDHSLCLRNCQF
jgi:hypothetical protein